VFPEARTLLLLWIQSWRSLRSVTLSVTPLRAGPVMTRMGLWHCAQLDWKRVLPSSWEWAGRLIRKLKQMRSSGRIASGCYGIIVPHGRRLLGAPTFGVVTFGALT